MLNSDYKDMLSLLVEHDVDFMLIGAYALAVHGIPRSTGDIDFFVECSPLNARKIYAALVEFGTPIAVDDADYLSHYGNMYRRRPGKKFIKSLHDHAGWHRAPPRSSAAERTRHDA